MDFLNTLNVEDNSNDFDYKKHIANSKEVNDKLEKYITGKIKKGYGIGLPVLDKVIVCKTKEMFACVGKKGRGKTTIQQILFLAWAMVHDLTFVLCLQENEDALAEKDLLGYLLGENPKFIYDKDRKLYNKAVNWLSEHFVFLKDIDDFKQATEVTEALIKSGKKVQALFLDPVNTIDSGWYESGNTWKDDKQTAKKLLKFSKKVCSVFLSQHPTMTAQRSPEDVTSYNAEGGHFLNKSDFTWVINRDNGSNLNRITVDNVRNKYTGGGITHPDTPLIMHWFPYSINLEHDGVIEENVLQKIRLKFNPLKENLNNLEVENKNILPTVEPSEAFGEDIPF